MIAALLPLAHHPLLTALPFVVPMLVIVGGLALMAVHDRLGARSDRERGEAPRSSA